MTNFLGQKWEKVRGQLVNWPRVSTVYYCIPLVHVNQLSLLRLYSTANQESYNQRCSKHPGLRRWPSLFVAVWKPRNCYLLLFTERRSSMSGRATSSAVSPTSVASSRQSVMPTPRGSASSSTRFVFHYLVRREVTYDQWFSLFVCLCVSTRLYVMFLFQFISRAVMFNKLSWVEKIYKSEHWTVWILWLCVWGWWACGSVVKCQCCDTVGWVTGRASGL